MVHPVVVLLLNENPEHLRHLTQYCLSRGYQIVAAARTLMGALQKLEAGEATTIVVASLKEIPYLESITGEIRQRRPGQHLERPQVIRDREDPEWRPQADWG